HRSEMGDGFNFRMKTFTAASEVMETKRTTGGEKDRDSCKAKWGKLKEAYEAIMKIKTYSGWGPWSDKHGAGITALTADVRERFVIKTKAAKPFLNNSWVYLSKMEQIM
ncbi:hypothetical protein BDP27DRAFT_1149519, partial [Rhodocollybia butyracea]